MYITQHLNRAWSVSVATLVNAITLAIMVALGLVLLWFVGVGLIAISPIVTAVVVVSCLGYMDKHKQSVFGFLGIGLYVYAWMSQGMVDIGMMSPLTNKVICSLGILVFFIGLMRAVHKK